MTDTVGLARRTCVPMPEARCPSWFCRGGSPGRGAELTEDDLVRIPERERPWITHAAARSLKCSYCGCVYKPGQTPWIDGFLDDGIGNSWIAAKHDAVSD
ncbi:hypothetical protein [Methylobacterium sp. WL9]|uniref:hypothetical protein n=1 Tax=Methylobacterium sp. WL9 TaxID=2603898 RepID=UPI0011C99323|nr:hypothetical protein [Methylobacterium sp. WL9]TXN21141.1 hypothetical protein FV217_15445 [Methylobacterium sp. WL9]